MEKDIIGRFAPSPSGRMHLGNIYTAVISYLSAKSKGGKWLLRIEDLDPQRSKRDFARLIEDDLQWLGLHWDIGGLNEECLQSIRGDIYEKYFQELNRQGLLYGCSCRRADIMATQAPHQSDGRIVYAGTCRPASKPYFYDNDGRAARIAVPDRVIDFDDLIAGHQSVNLAEFCGDFVLRRADGAWAYQLAVVVDDALMGVTEVVRGNDLLLSTVQQLYMYEVLGFEAPSFAHLPLMVNNQGIRLSKRDQACSMEYLRTHYSPEKILGVVAYCAGLKTSSDPISLTELVDTFNVENIRKSPTVEALQL